MSAEALLEQLAGGQITSVVVTKAYLQRAALASRLTNCATELLSERALERAAYLDDTLHRTKVPVGPLHGLPVSVKEHIGMRGLDLNGSFISAIGTVAKEDAYVLQLLWNAGCVFYVRTTQPQAIMHLETDNNIYGVTTNPYNTNLSSGGSSGGEGALLGLRGSCLGVGSDIGGSVRNPAANNGVFGLRPTAYRLPLEGCGPPQIGAEQIVPIIGPLSTTLGGINTFMKAIIDQQPWLYDSTLVPLPWKDPYTNTLLRTTADRRRLKIGVLADDGIVKPHPPILRAIDMITARLKRNPDIEVIDFPPYKHDEAWRIISSLYFPDGGAEEAQAINASGEPWLPLTDFIIKENANCKLLSIPELWQLTRERDEYRAAYSQHWNSVGTDLLAAGPPNVRAADHLDDFVDVILTPVGPGCATPHGCARYWGYTSQWNLLDYPALAFPTGLVVSSKDEAEIGYKSRNPDDEYNYKLCRFDDYA
ncbi:hypothetical protein AMS68_003334 [Peltaster fructicola]|uniref:amidase n=1 Tax=Peltaster fructicola TaxID=286661 RepID=A0A6H0XSS7_9PEZI|nr:hypothetical protein AMS68_003334 [Peltaster fructicola]